MQFQQTIQLFATGFEAAGVGVLVIGAALALVTFVVAFFRSRRTPGVSMAAAYRSLRRDLGRAILLGLEFLVAGDIIRSVAIQPTLDSVIVLGIIVLIRTFLSWSLEVEITGRWPWQGKRPGEATRQPGQGDDV